MTEDEMVGLHDRLNGHEFGWTPGVGVGQGGWQAAVHGITKSRTRLSELNWQGGKLFPSKIQFVGGPINTKFIIKTDPT